MIIYDATKNNYLPDCLTTFKGKVIRAVYNQDDVISALYGVHKKDGVHLYLRSSYGYSLITAYNPIHHHISILSSKPAIYANLFNTKKFIIEYVKKDKALFLQKRFPNWVLVGFSQQDKPRIELEVL